MKKVGKIFITLLLCIVSFGVFTACQQTGIASAAIEYGTFATTVVKDTDPVYDDIRVRFTYHDGTVKYAGTEDLVFGQVNTSTTGSKILKISYGDYSFTVKIKVIATEDQVSSIISMKSKLLLDYNANRTEQDNKQEEFYIKDQPLYVGIDNPFNFRLSTVGLDDSHDMVTGIQNVATTLTVKIKESDTFRLLTEKELSENTYFELLPNNEFQFTESAKNEVFHISMEAQNPAEDYDLANMKFATELTVVEGFNVYDAIDLSVYDNTEATYVTQLGVEGNGWHNIKEDANLLDVTTNAVILQNNIFVTKNDVPADWFWKTTDTDFDTINSLISERNLKGSLKDIKSNGIYRRTLKDGDQFEFIGNYFSVDFSRLPKAVVQDNVLSNHLNIASEEDSTYMTSHSAAFYTLYKQNVLDGAITAISSTDALWKNLYFIGNAELDQSPLNSGGIQNSVAYEVNFTAYNTIVHNTYTSYTFNLGYYSDISTPEDQSNDESFLGNYVLDNCKAYNSYGNLIYMWGAKNLLVIDSELKNAGGPAIIADHCGMSSDNPDSGYPSNINVVNSTIESKVTGKEPWFKIYEASSFAAQLAMLDLIYQNPAYNTKTIIAGMVGIEGDIPQINAMIVMKSSGEGLIGGQARGYARIFNNITDYEAFYRFENPDTSTTHGLELNKDADGPYQKSQGDAGGLIVQASGSGDWMGFKADFDNEGELELDLDSPLANSAQPNLIKGSYCNVYTFLGLGIVLQLYNR